MMELRLIKVIERYFTSTGIYEKYIVYWDANVLHVINKETLEEEHVFENTFGGSVYRNFLYIAEQDFTESVFDLSGKKMIKRHEIFFDNTRRIKNMQIGSFYAHTAQIDEDGEQYFFKYDLALNKLVYKGPANNYSWLALNEDFYLSWFHVRKYKTGGVLKVNGLQNSVVWKFVWAELGSYMDWDYIHPPVWKERKCYNMYYMDGMVFLSVSKGVVALAAETGKQLWWVDFNTTEKTTLRFDVKPNHLSFADGKIYIRDWRQFVSIDMKTGEILMRKKYIDFKVGNEIIRGTLDDGVKIHNGKGYFVLDVQAELYLTSLDLKTGEISIECELPDVKDQVSAENIHFEGNRLYLRDNASFLYVYEVTE
ncbi:hypothetical protein [Dubosiella newyorkensis]|uniref:hypothetical protein n=1 Tax=Dubosiella newyorkensis TaxID=1862672 RepID=UPI00272AE302|nr:hypothetical protein [Dubosiella newyorkensis]